MLFTITHVSMNSDTVYTIKLFWHSLTNQYLEIRKKSILYKKFIHKIILFKKRINELSVSHSWYARVWDNRVRNCVNDTICFVFNRRMRGQTPPNLCLLLLVTIVYMCSISIVPYYLWIVIYGRIKVRFIVLFIQFLLFKPSQAD